MVRGLIAFLVLTMVLGVVGYRWYVQNRTARDQLQAQIGSLNQRLNQLQAENERLQESMSKLQEENERVTANAESLRKAIEQSKVSGKPAEEPQLLPYPPK